MAKSTARLLVTNVPSVRRPDTLRWSADPTLRRKSPSRSLLLIVPPSVAFLSTRVKTYHLKKRQIKKYLLKQKSAQPGPASKEGANIEKRKKSGLTPS